jgi:hypothetical protein
MPRLFFGNFEFEHELATSEETKAVCADEIFGLRRLEGAQVGAELAWTWVAIAEAVDSVVAPGEIKPDEFAALSELGLPIPQFLHSTREIAALRDVELVPWGWTNSLTSIGKSYGFRCLAPPPDVVRRVNSRAFRLGLEHNWKVGLPGSAAVGSVSELESLLSKEGNRARGWLLKANFGMSGRESLRGRGTVLDASSRNWVQKRLSTGPVVFEPVVERLAEAGIQFEIPQVGTPELVGVTPLLVDQSGTYRGSRFACPPGELEAWAPANEAGLRTAMHIQRLGYFGPLGIDAMQYLDEAGHVRLRPLQDLNARYTMGRLALGFRRILRPGWNGSWIHFGERHLAAGELKSSLSHLRHAGLGGAIIVAASPRKIGGRAARHHAVLVIAPTIEILKQAEGKVFDSLKFAFDASRR